MVRLVSFNIVNDKKFDMAKVWQNCIAMNLVVVLGNISNIAIFH